MSAALALSACLDSYRTNFKPALARAAQDGFRACEADTLSPDFDPADFPHSAQRHLSRHLAQLGLGLDTISAAFPGRGLADPECAEQRLAHLRSAMNLAAAIHVPHASTTLSGFDQDRSRPLALELLKEVADLADRAGVALAIHATDADPAHLAAAVDTLRCPALRIGLDLARVANLTALRGVPLGSVYCRDVLRTADGIEEVEFGRGSVDFESALGLLSENAYDGALTIRRDAPGEPQHALRQGRAFIEALLARGANQRQCR